ncbi:MAG: ribonuclease HII [Oscillospiraceae bacterium]|jgi:ribonuclease HII|nr:ribonuclease HII [Oscillospiraceae bacterium]
MTRRTERQEALRDFDAAYWARGLRIAGMDEAGRGALAGPVVAACVIMPDAPILKGVDDSKKLTPGQRAELYNKILETALFIGVGSSNVREIAELNIRSAALLAMKRAAEGLECDLLLTDGLDKPDVQPPCEAVAHGDERSYSIAAASIVAKVTRDRFMEALDGRLPGYGFAQHKGYGTDAHYKAILLNGASEEHRALFLRSMDARYPAWNQNAVSP